MDEIRQHMLNDLMVIRSEEKCIHLREQLERLKNEAANASYDGLDAWSPYQMRNMFITAYMMLEAAQARKESRGSHYREDYPEESDSFNRPFIIKKH